MSSRPAGDAGSTVRHVRCVGAIVFDGAGRLLLIQRGHEPAAGRWSVPGGKVEPGESDEDAVAREVAEETGLAVTVGSLAGVVTRAGIGDVVFDIYDYDAAVTGDSTQARAGSDAADLRWVAPDELSLLPLTDGLVEALRDWGRLP